MRWPTTRAMMSLGPPGGNGTISRTTWFGKVWAWIGALETSAVMIARAAATRRMRDSALGEGRSGGMIDGEPRFCQPAKGSI